MKHAAGLAGVKALDPLDLSETGEPPMAAMGPSRLELSKPVIAVISGTAVAGGMELAMWAILRGWDPMHGEEAHYVGEPLTCRDVIELIGMLFY